MKRLFQLVGLMLVAGIAVVVFRATRQESSAEQPASTKRTIPPHFLAILADPVDKAPVELMTDSDGNEWLVNRARGYRYPVKNGIPMMRIEDGEPFNG